jgi:hypothetical protein
MIQLGKLEVAALFVQNGSLGAPRLIVLFHVKPVAFKLKWTILGLTAGLMNQKNQISMT